MGKQAMGNVAFNQLNRMDTLLYLLCYPQVTGNPCALTTSYNHVQVAKHQQVHLCVFGCEEQTH
jgi:hypothetical protein